MDAESSLIEELDLSFQPLTQKLWRDFEMLFGRNGACGGCWCMYWKLRGKAFSENTGDVARQMQKSIVEQPQPRAPCVLSVAARRAKPKRVLRKMGSHAFGGCSPTGREVSHYSCRTDGAASRNV